MAWQMTRKDVDDLGGDKISIPYAEAQHLLRPYERIGYKAGTYGWDCDVYKVNGLVITTGYRNMQSDTRYSYKLLHDLDKQASKIFLSWGEYPSYDAKIQKVTGLMDEFCDSVKRGIRDPEIIEGFADYKRELADQKRQHPDKKYSEIAKELVDYYKMERLPDYSGSSNERVRNLINEQLKKRSDITERYPKESDGQFMERVLGDIAEGKTMKEIAHESRISKTKLVLHNELSRNDRLPEGLTTTALVYSARGLFSSMLPDPATGKSEPGQTSLKEVKDFFVAHGAYAKADGNGWKISYEKFPSPERERNIASGRGM